MTIRSAAPSDAPDIAKLCIQLGYPVDTETTAARLTRLADRHDHVVLVAILEGRIVAWVQAHATEALESGRRGEIVGLVVSKECRRRGIGRILVQRVQRWAVATGAEALVVRSSTKRIESHAFYPALGFSLSKTQAVYRKALNGA